MKAAADKLLKDAVSGGIDPRLRVCLDGIAEAVHRLNRQIRLLFRFGFCRCDFAHRSWKFVANLPGAGMQPPEVVTRDTSLPGTNSQWWVKACSPGPWTALTNGPPTPDYHQGEP
jgi:hypothetical protein